MRMFDLVSLRVDVLNFALVNYSVPAERVKRLLPDIYELQTYIDEAGTERCFVTTTCFCNHDFRWAASRHPTHTFNESTYRTYVRHGGNDGVYFFGRFLGTGLAVGAQRTLARDTFLADFEISTEQDEGGYNSYVLTARGDKGETTFSIEARDVPQARAPFESGYEHAQFLTYRLKGYFTSTLGVEGCMPVSHARMDPWEGTLRAARFQLWEDLEVLDREEAQNPYSVLVQPAIGFRLHPPRPLLA